MRNLFFNLGRGKGDRDGDRPDPHAESDSFLGPDDRIDVAKIRSLMDTMAELITDVDIHRVQESVVDRAIQLVGAERGILFLYGTSQDLQVRVARDQKGRDLERPVQYSTTVTNKAEAGHALSLKVGESDSPIDLSQSVVDLKLRAVMCVRLSFRDENLGVIYVDSRATAREFTKADLSFFKALASSLSIAIANANLVSAAIERERLKESLAVAKRIQSALMPSDPTDLEGWDLAGWSVPAEEALGDYYDFIRLPDDRLGIAVGDVSGHGVGPALLMASARSLLRAYTSMGLPVGGIMARINNQFAEDLEDGMFMSLFFGILDLKNRTMTYANAGQTPPVWIRKKGDQEDLKVTGPALGVESAMPYDEIEIGPIKPGDVFGFFTDGILELKNERDELFGRSKLSAILVDHRSKSARDSIDAVRREISSFHPVQEMDDDLTLAIVRLKADSNNP